MLSSYESPLYSGRLTTWNCVEKATHVQFSKYIWNPAVAPVNIDFVEAGNDWPSADHPGEDSLYVWGPSVPEDFIVNYELASR